MQHQALDHCVGHYLDTEALQDLYYRCRFSELLGRLAGSDLGQQPSLALLGASAYFELHQVGEAKAALEAMATHHSTAEAGYFYAVARLSYLDDRPGAARALFAELNQRGDADEYRFKSLLGIANAYYTEGNLAALPELLEELHAFEPLPRLDERLSFMIFLGNYYLSTDATLGLARQYFKKALAAAAANNWTYFITRCLYGLATVAEKDGQMAELGWTLDLLRAFVDQSEQRFFSHVINERFKPYIAIETPMEFDTANKRILVRNRWLPCHDRPLLFRFLLLLHESGCFVGKSTIAQSLWPNESYKPRLHDPRIFDIAKRARNLVESYEHQPAVLLSSRLGYKLASS